MKIDVIAANWDRAEVSLRAGARDNIREIHKIRAIHQLARKKKNQLMIVKEKPHQIVKIAKKVMIFVQVL